MKDKCSTMSTVMVTKDTYVSKETRQITLADETQKYCSSTLQLQNPGTNVTTDERDRWMGSSQVVVVVVSGMQLRTA